MIATEQWEKARQLKQAGDLARAELAFQQIIQGDPGNDAAWEKLGEVNEAQGKLSEAVTHYQHVLRIQPDSPDAYFRLGCIAGSQRRPGEAVSHFRQAVRYKPDHVEALTSLGVTLAEQGNLAEALANLGAAARLEPASARIQYNLGVALTQQGAAAEGEQAFREAICLQPDYAAPHYGLGNLHHSQGKFEEAMACFREALRRKPDYGEACNNLGLALSAAGRPEEAVVFLQQTVRLTPAFAEGHNNLGLALAELGRFAEAEACYAEALRLNPRFADAHNNFGSAYKEQGRLEEALASYQLALWLSPDLASVRWNRSLALLQMGRFEEGWPEYEWRWKRHTMGPRPLPQPRWDGSPLEGRTLLIYMEQGLGDMIQFIRYAPLARATVGRVVVECPASLVALFSTCQGIDALVAEGTPLPEFDVQIPILSLPAALKTTVATIPVEIPYLTPRPERMDHWREKLAGIAGFKIGLAWQGNPKHPWDRHRSFPLAQLAPLARIPGVRLVSLQKGPGVEQLQHMGNRLEVAILAEDLDSADEAFADTAAIIANLDLVITADTALAHLAGALGAPVWVAMSAIADWRWLRGRDDSPWYPKLRLFRQSQLGQWKAVFEAMARNLWNEIGTGNLNDARETQKDGGIRVEISPGELIDKITILEIKSARMKAPAKLLNVRHELVALRNARNRQLRSPSGLAELEAALKTVNESLWEIEEGLRAFERRGDLGSAFIEMARSVYCQNDRRAALKRQINDLLGACVVEEKSYEE